MSYILDALKKADADRERDTAAVPGLYAQADAAPLAHRPSATPGWAWMALALGVVAIAASAWHWWGAAADDDAAAAPASAPAAVARAAAVAAPPPVAPPAPAAPPPAAPNPAMARAPAAAAAPAVVPAVAPIRSRPTVAAASPPSNARLPTLSELPPELRRQLPALAVGGSMYSPKQASRMVVLNGQVFREGDKPVEGMAVEQIGLKSTVLSFRGVRFELKH